MSFRGLSSSWKPFALWQKSQSTCSASRKSCMIDPSPCTRVLAGSTVRLTPGLILGFDQSKRIVPAPEIGRRFGLGHDFSPMAGTAIHFVIPGWKHSSAAGEVAVDLPCHRNHLARCFLIRVRVAGEITLHVAVSALDSQSRAEGFHDEGNVGLGRQNFQILRGRRLRPPGAASVLARQRDSNKTRQNEQWPNYARFHGASPCGAIIQDPRDCRSRCWYHSSMAFYSTLDRSIFEYALNRLEQRKVELTLRSAASSGSLAGN